MDKRTKKQILVLSLLTLIALAVPFFHTIFADSFDRIEREHHVELPASAADPECQGKPLRRIWDDGDWAAATCSIDRSDLEEFIKHCVFPKVENGATKSSFPEMVLNMVRAPWAKLQPEKTYHSSFDLFQSTDIQIFSLDANRVGICLYTVYRPQKLEEL